MWNQGGPLSFEKHESTCYNKSYGNRTVIRVVAQEILSRYPVEFAYLYGSFAEGSERPWSDMDLALIVKSTVSPAQYLSLEMEIARKIEEKLPGMEVDARIFNSAPLNYKIQVVQNGKLIYSVNEGKRVEFETQTRDEYFDFLPIYREFQKNLLENVEKGGLLWSIPKK